MGQDPRAGYIREYDEICRETERLVSGLTDARFNWRPGPGQWSVAECLGHLIMTGRFAGQIIDGLISQAQAQNLHSPGPYRQNLMGRLLLRLLEPPYRVIKIKSPKPYRRSIRVRST